MRVGKKRAKIVQRFECKSVIAEAVGISAKHVHRKSKLDEKDEVLKKEIEETHKKHKAYGHRRLAIHLQINHKRIARVMKKYGIKPPRRRSKQFCTRSTSHHAYTNLIKELVVTRPNQLWCSDVSFFWFAGGWWYLATIEDVYTRQVIAAQVGKFHNAQLILRTIQQAIATTGSVPEIFHTDQGTEFMAGLCTNYLENLGVMISVSDKASPWQNGYKESFFGRFKEEFGDVNRFETVGQLIEEIYSQIRYYNEERIHTALKMPPAVFAKKVGENSLLKWGT